MNILFITPYYPPLSFGGIESQVRSLSQTLSKTENCSIIAPSIDKEKVSFEDKVKVYRTKRINPTFKYETNKEADYKFFDNVLKKEKIDKIIASNLFTWVSKITIASLLKACKDNNVKIYLRVHNYATHDSVDMLKNRQWEKYLCISKDIGNQIVSLGVDKSRVKIVYPPIDTNIFYPKRSNSLREKLNISKKSVLIIQASRIAGGGKTFEEKGIPDLLEIFPKINKNTHLLFCVAATVKESQNEFNKAIEKIQKISEELNIDERVHIISASYEEMPEVYNNGDLFVMLSRIETFGRVYGEAMACGLPVIGLNVGGIPEVIANFGFIVNSKEEALEKLKLLIKNKELRKKIGEKAKEFIRDTFSLEKIIKEILEILKD